VQCTEGEGNYGREYVLGEKTTGRNISWVSKMTGGNMFGREFFRIPKDTARKDFNIGTH